MSNRVIRWSVLSVILLICALLAAQSLTLEIGLYRFSTGDFRGALPWLRVAMVLNPFTGSIRSAVATILMRQGRLDEAERIIRKNLKKHPNDSHDRNTLGMILEKEGDVSGALNEYHAALNAAPKNSAALFNTGYLMFKMKKYGEAREYLNRAAQISPELSKARDEILGKIPAAQSRAFSISPAQ